jgi:DNA-binding transcriptional MerR regulator
MSGVSDNSTERLLRSRDVAERFAVTTRTVNRWGDEGVIPVVRVSGVRRYRARDVERLIDRADRRES